MNLAYKCEPTFKVCPTERTSAWPSCYFGATVQVLLQSVIARLWTRMCWGCSLVDPATETSEDVIKLISSRLQ